jgi:hypothetical protein
LDQLRLTVEISKACADLIDHAVQRAKDAVAEIVLTQVVPEVFPWVEFRAVGRQPQQVHRRGDLQRGGGMPSRSIQEHEAVFFTEVGCGVSQEHRHSFGIHPGQNQRAKSAVQGTHRGQTVDKLPYDLLAHDGAQGPGGPAATLIADTAKAGFVLKQQSQTGTGGQLSQNRFEDLGKFFLKRCCALGWAWGWRGRGPSLRHPQRCNRR